ncbi:MAG TPA: hypothetical protein VK636_14250 [Gemmatimonadaceae bacterium]|nr:hypothetical protein [Gemmatimonadaceae bacterium]
MRTQLTLLVVSSILAAACARQDPGIAPLAVNDHLLTITASNVDILAEGGIAAIAENQQVSHDDGRFVTKVRQHCTATCPAPLDSASGTLAGPAVDSLFAGIVAQAPFDLKDDYGDSKGAADMLIYTVRITLGGRTKTVHADDGTMPPQLHRIVDAVRASISAARR